MCNRLWEYLDQVAWAKKTNGKVISLFWDESLDDFDNLRHCPYINFPLYSRYIRKGLKGKLYRFVWRKILHNNLIQNIFASSLFRNMGFISGKEIIYQHCFYHEIGDEIMPYFSPNKEISERLDIFFQSLRNADDSRIVGVHIRRGDYREYQNGRFFYTDDEYAGFMQQLVALFGKDVRFLLVSNEKINIKAFEQFNLIALNNSKPAEDMYTLSKCDYIIGPYSSFSSWASFYGKVPLCLLKRNMNICPDNFRVVNNFFPPSVIAQ